MWPIQYVGTDGNSMICVCGWDGYIVPEIDKVACPSCGGIFDWKPRPVSCASPDHNDETGCGNPNCWKHHSSIRGTPEKT